MPLEIESWEDRSYSSDPGPKSFGYVYFNDGSRVGFSPGVPDSPAVWEPRTNGGGRHQPVTAKHLKMAEELLREEGIL